MEKVITFNGGSTGLSLYLTIMRQSHGTYLDATDFTFKDRADPILEMEELSAGDDTQMYEWRNDETAWKDGQYIVVVYQQIGAEPALDTDAVLATATLNVRRNAIRERRYSYSGR